MPVGTAATVKAMTARGGGRDRRADPARQHLSPDAAARRRAHRRARRAAPLHELAAPDPDRFRRVSGHVARPSCARSTRTASPSARISTAAPHLLTPGALDRDPASARRRHRRWRSTNAPPFPSPRGRRSRHRWNCRCAGPSARARPLSSGRATAIFGIVQGGVYPDLRQRSAARLVDDRLRRLCGRRARGRRGAGGDVRDARRDRAGAARRTGRAI